MQKLPKGLCLTVALLLTSLLYADGNDSLRRMLKNAPDDTSRMVIYMKLAAIPGQDISLCMSYLDSALVIGERVSNKNYVGRVIKNKGDLYQSRAQPDSAVVYLRQAIDVFTLTGNWSDLVMTHYSLGNAYSNLEKNDLALQSFIDGSKIAVQRNLNRENTYCVNGIATSYFKQKNYPQAKRYHTDALNTALDLGDPKLIAWIYTGLANTLITTGNIDSALICFNNALVYYTKANYLPGIAGAHNNIGVCFSYKENYDEAISNYRIAASAKHAYREFNGESTALNNISQLFILMKNADSAIYYARASYAISLTVPSLAHKRQAVGVMAEAYEYAKQYDSAFKYEKLCKEYTDSVNDESLNQKIAEMQGLFNNEQQEQKITLLEQSNQIGTLYNYVFGAGGMIVLIIGLFIYMRYRSKKKANVVLAEQNAQIIQQKKEITDSIQYAKRIQQALLATDSMIRDHVRDFFILYKPKDIVSGDFYWATFRDQSFWIAVCDSTGHGVPGAFMSLLNTTFLSEAINEKNIPHPADVFNFARKKLLESLSQTQGYESAGNDGMDGTLLKISGNRIQYAGANGTGLLVRNGIATELNTDKMPVGRSPRENESFTTHELHVQKGDAVYLFTDGYADQFGGEKGKKFMHKNLVQLLSVNSTLSSAAQRELLESALEKWKGTLEQIDDVLIVGIFF